MHARQAQAGPSQLTTAEPLPPPQQQQEQQVAAAVSSLPVAIRLSLEESFFLKYVLGSLTVLRRAQDGSIAELDEQVGVAGPTHWLQG